MPDSVWLPFHRTTIIPPDSTRLLCLPFAGGGASSYASWLSQTGTDVIALPIQLPGREHRHSDQPFRDMSSLIGALMRYVVEPLGGRIAIFGHSMGALIGTELAIRMTAEGMSPEHLFVSGFPPPHHPRDMTSLHTLPRDAMFQALARLDGLRPEVLASSELLDMLEPRLRADLELEEKHAVTPRPSLRCGVTVFAASGDPLCDAPAQQAWSKATSGPCSIHVIRGNHFAIFDDLDATFDVIARTLRRTPDRSPHATSNVTPA